VDAVDAGTNAAIDDWNKSVDKGDVTEQSATKAVTAGLNAAAGAVGAAAATAACAATGVGAVAAPLCGILGGVIGQKLIGPLVKGIENVGKAIGHFFSDLFSSPPPPPILVLPSDQPPVPATEWVGRQIQAFAGQFEASSDMLLLNGVNALVALAASLQVPPDNDANGKPVPYDFTYAMWRLALQGLRVSTYPTGTGPGGAVEVLARLTFAGDMSILRDITSNPYGFIDWPSVIGPPKWGQEPPLTGVPAGNDPLYATKFCGLDTSQNSVYAPVTWQTGQDERERLQLWASQYFGAFVPSGNAMLFAALSSGLKGSPVAASPMGQLLQMLVAWRTQAAKVLAREALSLTIAGVMHQAVGSQSVALALASPPGLGAPVVDGIRFLRSVGNPPPSALGPSPAVNGVRFLMHA
jgi:hypothetical protein